jgi:hypothetical protein
VIAGFSQHNDERWHRANEVPQQLRENTDMETNSEHPETPAKEQAPERLPDAACSDLIEVRMRGGTIIRIPAGRGDGMPYDLLLEALKVCQHWDDDEEEWRDGDPFVYLEVIHGQNKLL